MEQVRAHRSGEATLRAHLAAIADFSRTALRGDLPLNALLEAACLAACRGSGLARSKALLIEPDGRHATIEVGVGWAPGVVGMRVPVHERSSTSPALAAERPMMIDDLPNDPAFDWEQPLRSHGIVSLVNVPIRTEGSVVGLLEIDSHEPIALDGDDSDFLTSLAALVGAALLRRDADLMAERATSAAVTAAAEREVLHAEFEHRIKNHLHQIQLLLELERQQVPEDSCRALIARVQERMRGSLHLQDGLSGQGLAEDGHGLNIRAFLEALARDFERFSRIRTRVEAEAVLVPVNLALRVGRLVHEVAMNALKHAFVGRPLGSLHIGLSRADTDRLLLEMHDDGRGMAPGRPGGRGRALNEALAAQLGGTLVQDETPGTGGTRYRVEFDIGNTAAER